MTARYSNMSLMTRVSDNDDELRQTFNLANSYPELTSPTYQDSAGLRDYEECHSIAGRHYQTVTSGMLDTGYIENINHDDETKHGSEITAIDSWPTQSVVPCSSLAAFCDLKASSSDATTFVPTFGASTSALNVNVGHWDHASIRSSKNVQVVDSSSGENRPGSLPFLFSNGGISASFNAGHTTQRERVHCAWSGCTKTFGRLQELVRHHNTVHELTTPFWCPVPSCDRSESFPGRKRPFPRRDKLASHLRHHHRGAFNSSGTSGFPAVLAVGSGGYAVTEWATGRSGSNMADGPNSVRGLPVSDGDPLSNGFVHSVGPIGGYEPSGLKSVSSSDWFTGIDSVSSFNEFFSTNRTDIAGFDALGGANGMYDPQNIPTDDTVSDSNGYVCFP